MNNTKEVQAMQLPIQKLRPFENHPFQVKDDDEMNHHVFLSTDIIINFLIHNFWLFTLIQLV